MEKKDFNSLKNMSDLALINYIIKTYHSPTREYLSDITMSLRDIISDRKKNNLNIIELKEISHLFLGLASDIEYHLDREELVVFQIVEKYEKEHDNELKEILASPIIQMEAEHAEQYGTLEAIKNIIKNSSLLSPIDLKINSLFSKLDNFITMTVEHMELEDNLLFPKLKL